MVILPLWYEKNYIRLMVILPCGTKKTVPRLIVILPCGTKKNYVRGWWSSHAGQNHRKTECKLIGSLGCWPNKYISAAADACKLLNYSHTRPCNATLCKSVLGD